MTHIPQDIMDKTTACILAACGQPRMADIAELVWEERQRCCEIATRHLRNTSHLLSNPPKSAAAWDIRNEIARPS